MGSSPITGIAPPWMRSWRSILGRRPAAESSAQPAHKSKGATEIGLPTRLKAHVHADVNLAVAPLWWHMQSSKNNNKAGGGRRAEGSGPGCVSIVMGPPPQMVFDLQALSCFVWLALSRGSGSRCKLDMACSPNEIIRSKIRRGKK